MRLISGAMGWEELPRGETTARLLWSMAVQDGLPLLFWGLGLPPSLERRWDA